MSKCAKGICFVYYIEKSDNLNSWLIQNITDQSFALLSYSVTVWNHRLYIRKRFAAAFFLSPKPFPKVLKCYTIILRSFGVMPDIKSKFKYGNQYNSGEDIPSFWYIDGRVLKYLQGCAQVHSLVCRGLIPESLNLASYVISTLGNSHGTPG